MSSPSKSCVVCQLKDARALTTTMLATGANVVVCGSHALMHERAATRATSVATLREMFGDRRDRKERRDGTADELGARLIEAFVGDRRRTDERRSL